MCEHVCCLDMKSGEPLDFDRGHSYSVVHWTCHPAPCGMEGLVCRGPVGFRAFPVEFT